MQQTSKLKKIYAFEKDLTPRGCLPLLQGYKHVYDHYFQSSSLKPLGQIRLNFMWLSFRREDVNNKQIPRCKIVLVTPPLPSLTLPYPLPYPTPPFLSLPSPPLPLPSSHPTLPLPYPTLTYPYYPTLL